MSYINDLKNRFNASERTADPVRVALYTRVSTTHKGQEDSPEHQEEMCRNYLANHPNVLLLRTLCDHGLSGTNEINRPMYNRLLKMIEDREIDLVIVKDSSRLNRNMFGNEHLKSLMIRSHCSILYLDKKTIYDFESDTDVIIDAIEAAFNERYSRKQSKYGRDHQALRIEKLDVGSKGVSFGYIWVKMDSKDGKLQINPNEEEIVKYIFDAYLFQGLSYKEIADKLKVSGFTVKRRINKSSKGQKPVWVEIERPLCSKTICNILKDERYIGRFPLNKKSSDFNVNEKTRRYFLPKEEWIYVEMPELRIIDDEIFYMVQKLRKTRETICVSSTGKDYYQRHFVGFHLFAGKVFCVGCGRNMQHDIIQKTKAGVYRVRSHGRCAYPAPRLLETDLENMIRTGLKECISNQDEVFGELEKILEQCVRESHNNTSDLQKQKKALVTLQEEMDSLYSFLRRAKTLDDDGVLNLTEQINALSREISDKKAKISTLEAARLNDSYVSQTMASIRASIEDIRSFDNIDRSLVQRVIDRINVYHTGDIDLILQMGIVIQVHQNPARQTMEFRYNTQSALQYRDNP